MRFPIEFWVYKVSGRYIFRYVSYSRYICRYTISVTSPPDGCQIRVRRNPLHPLYVYNCIFFIQAAYDSV